MPTVKTTANQSGQNAIDFTQLAQLFENRRSQAKHAAPLDPAEHRQWLLEAAGLSVDLSRSGIDQNIVNALISLAKKHQLEAHIQSLLAGDEVNNTEQRAALHTALRVPVQSNPKAEVVEAQQQMQVIAESIRNRRWRGSGDSDITDVVNIGIGGSDLGPRMVCSALAGLATQDTRVHFVANVDPRDLELTLQNLKPQNTLFIISSKSFGTTETLENALSARRWLLASIDEESLSQHVIAVSSNIEKAVAFGVDARNILPMWDWVGGRYSLWSAIGLPIAIAVGFDNFRRLLDGAHAMDQHFANAPLEQNLPCLLGLIEIGYVNACDAKSVAVLPYSHELRLFPDYLQQLTMESNGKRVLKDGSPLQGRSCPTIWGSAGTIGQHSFHQLLHQGTELIPVDFIVPLHSHSSDRNKQAHLVANALAQSKALTEGKSEQQAKQELLAGGASETQAERLAKHKAIPGNRPNTLIMMDRLSPESLGALVALYEHKVHVQSVIWGINAFDQWGVELGKQLSTPIYQALNNSDVSTRGVVMSASSTDSDNLATDATTAFWVQQFNRC